MHAHVCGALCACMESVRLGVRVRESVSVCSLHAVVSVSRECLVCDVSSLLLLEPRVDTVALRLSPSPLTDTLSRPGFVSEISHFALSQEITVKFM